METITTNKQALANRIEREIIKAFKKCQQAAQEGRLHIYFETDRDINKEVRNELKTRHKIYVPTIFSRNSPSRPAVEHNGDKTEFKLQW